MYIRKVLEAVFHWTDECDGVGTAMVIRTKRLVIEIDRLGGFKNSEKKHTGKEWLDQWVEQGYFRYRDLGHTVERCIDINKPYQWIDKRKLINQKRIDE